MSYSLRLRRALIGAVAGAMVLSLLPAGAAFAGVDEVCENAPSGAFNDVASTNPHASNIDCLAAYEITTGTSATTFSPGANTTRGQMASFLVNFIETATGEELDAPASSPFTDISGNIHAANINKLVEAGVTSGVTPTLFNPGGLVTRAQMASFTANALVAIGVTLDFDADDAFTDTNGNVHEANINALADAGVVSGTGGGLFSPGAPVTRQQMATFLIQAAGVADDQGLWNASLPGDGPISLGSTSAAAGGTITGSVADSHLVTSVAVTGCGFTNTALTIDGDGEFELTIPGGQAPGACSLTFSILYTDGSSEQQTISFNVTAIAQVATAAPDLLSASRSGHFVTYRFDDNVTGKVLVPGDFHVYNAAGVRTAATDVQPATSDTNAVVAQFPSSGSPAANATLATVRDGAVANAAGATNHASGVPLGAQVRPERITEAPDLISLTNVRVDQGGQVGPGFILADFRFDEEIEDVEGVPASPISTNVPASFVPSANFFLITSDGDIYPSVTIFNTSADNRTLSVAFDPTPAVIPIGNVVRGGVLAGVVEDDDGNLNVTQTRPRTAPPAYTSGVTADRTDRPDITATAIAGPDVIAITFDQPVQPGSIVPGNIYIYDHDGASTPATAAVRSSTNTHVVNATFTPATVAAAVGVLLEPAAVFTIEATPQPNVIHEFGIQDVASTAGRTALPDLVRVNITFNAFGDATVVYTFDQSVLGLTVSADNFFLIDAQGTRFNPSGAGNIFGTNDTQVRFRLENTNQFTNAQAAAAVRGAVQDDAAAPGPGAIYPEGSVAVTR